MKNVFENAYFGKEFKTRNGKIATFIGNSPNIFDKKINYMITLDDNIEPVTKYQSFSSVIFYNEKGCCLTGDSNLDIVF